MSSKSKALGKKKEINVLREDKKYMRFLKLKSREKDAKPGSKEDLEEGVIESGIPVYKGGKKIIN